MTIKEAIDELEKIKRELEHNRSEFREACKKTNTAFLTGNDVLNKAIDALKKEHPIKTYNDDFFEKFPNAKKAEDGTPYGTCVDRIYGTHFNCEEAPCSGCWMKEYKEEE